MLIGFSRNIFIITKVKKDSNGCPTITLPRKYSKEMDLSKTYFITINEVENIDTSRGKIVGEMPNVSKKSNGIRQEEILEESQESE
jgi:hypothetical protein